MPFPVKTSHHRQLSVSGNMEDLGDWETCLAACCSLWSQRTATSPTLGNLRPALISASVLTGWWHCKLSGYRRDTRRCGEGADSIAQFWVWIRLASTLACSLMPPKRLAGKMMMMALLWRLETAPLNKTTEPLFRNIHHPIRYCVSLELTSVIPKHAQLVSMFFKTVKFTCAM